MRARQREESVQSWQQVFHLRSGNGSADYDVAQRMTDETDFRRIQSARLYVVEDFRNESVCHRFKVGKCVTLK